MNKKRMANVILSLLEELRQHENKFYNYTSMTIEIFDHLLKLAGPAIQKQL
jgi:hypothetical protein